MAIKSGVVFALFFVFALASADEAFTPQILKGSVACLDCNDVSDLSGIQVLVKCDKVKKLSMAYTEADGTFQTELPSDSPNSATPSNCVAKIMGGPYQLYTRVADSVTQITESTNQEFTTSKPLSFYKSCPEKAKCGNIKETGIASSKTVDLPLPREWGFAPTSYYVPFLPIIGIP